MTDTNPPAGDKTLEEHLDQILSDGADPLTVGATGYVDDLSTLRLDSRPE